MGVLRKFIEFLSIMILLSDGILSSPVIQLPPVLAAQFKTENSEKNHRNSNKQQFIYGGNDVDISEFPYQLSLLYAGMHLGGASIIGLKWALTAAHCFNDEPPVSWISFRAGTNNRYSGGTIFDIIRYVTHPQFEPLTFDYDVAVVQVVRPFNSIINVYPIPLIREGLLLQANTQGVVVGWGVNEEGNFPLMLRKVKLPVFRQKECEQKWFGVITERMICAGGNAGYDACNGDSGGPMVLNGIQIGIVSWGATECGISMPGVYTNITNPSIRLFIREYTNI